MSEQEFLQQIYFLAEHILKRPLTSAEKQEIIDQFNNSEGEAFDRAMEAVAKVTKNATRVLLEKSASFDNINRVITDLKKVAENWQKGKK